MSGAAPITDSNDLDFDLDIFGQQPGLGIYTQLCLCYPINDPASHSAIVETLEKGLGKLSAEFPWVAGQVVREEPVGGRACVFKIKALGKNPRFSVKDLRDNPSIPTMEAMITAKFPFHMLDEGIICPRRTLPGNPDEVTSDNPVFLLQANFITGGLLLSFLSQHQTMDMTGMGQIMHLLSKACHDEPFTSEELKIGNIPRLNIIPLLDDSYQPGPELDRQIVKPQPMLPTPATPVPPAKSTWAYFDFSPASLAALKEAAANSLHSGFVSTDDALTALLWQSISRARLPRLESTREVTLARAVDPRRYLDVPSTYTGVVQNMTYHTYTIQQLVDEPLGIAASGLRAAVDPQTSKLAFNTRALVTVLDRSVNKTGASVTASLDLSADIMLSSWAKTSSYDLDFNLGLGKPESVRRPQFSPFASLLYLMPKSLDGGIAAALCLTDDDMEILKADKGFSKYGEFIG
jgi:hypothetical protein